MVVLSAIGRFFKKIWDWIKQTAWIQPLLIVGIIFGVIFSIPSIVSAIDAAGKRKDSAEVYFLDYQCSLSGENSEADQLIQKIENPNGSTDKFFLTFVRRNDNNVDAIKGGFKYLQDKFGKGIFTPNDETETFKLVTIFVDQETKATTDEKSAFDLFLERNINFFYTASGNAQKTDYFAGGHITETEVSNLENPDTFQVPTIMLIDLAPSDEELARLYTPGVTEVMFGINGSNDNEKAQTLMHCWNHSDEFNIND